MVLLYQSAPNELQIPCVTVENKLGSRKLIDHLIEVHGYQRIAFLAGPEGNEDSYWRKMGYLEALASHNLDCDSVLIATGGFDEEEAKEPIRKWLAGGVKMDAIFTGDDGAATGVIAALRQAGLRVPEDIAIVGFDDVSLSRHLIPPLTTVRAPIETVGYEAARQLVSLIQTGAAEPLVLLPTELVVRQSCGCNG